MFRQDDAKLHIREKDSKFQLQLSRSLESLLKSGPWFKKKKLGVVLGHVMQKVRLENEQNGTSLLNL